MLTHLTYGGWKYIFGYCLGPYMREPEGTFGPFIWNVTGPLDLLSGTWQDFWTFYLERDRTFGPFIWKVTGPLDLLSGTWEDLWTFYLERDMTFGPKSQKMGLWDGVNAPLSSFKVAEDIYVIKLNGKRVRCIATTNMVFSKLHETSKTFTGTIPILSSAWEYIKIWAVLIEFESVKILVTRQ